MAKDIFSIIAKNLSISPISGFLTTIITTGIIILIGIIFGKIMGRLAGRFIEEIKLNKITKLAGIKARPHIIADQLVRYLIYIAAFIIAINNLGISTAILNLIFGAFLIIIIIAILLSLKDFMPNLISGLYIHSKGDLEVGQNIEVVNVKGKIEYINLTETRLKTQEGNTILIPNSILTKNQIKIKKK